MSTESVFNKRLRPETTFDRIEAILEHLNMPPGVVEFIRKNRRLVVVLFTVHIVAIVAVSFYLSYKEEQRSMAASALSLAEEQKGVERITALENVAADFSSTSSALWAKVNVAQQYVKEGNYDKAVQQYQLLIEKEGQKNPVWPLLVFGKAEALEGGKLWEQAIAEYTLLQDIAGYEALGYLGVGRIYRQQNMEEKALAVYNNFLLKAGDDSRLQADKQVVEAEIARVKMIIENKK